MKNHVIPALLVDGALINDMLFAKICGKTRNQIMEHLSMNFEVPLLP